MSRVDLREAVAHLHRERHGLFDGDALLVGAEEASEVGALEPLHHHVLGVLEGADVDDARDVLVLDLGADLGFAAEAGAEARLPRLVVDAEELERDLLAQHEVRGRHDDAHAALAEQRLDAVLAVDQEARRQILGRERSRPRQARRSRGGRVLLPVRGFISCHFGLVGHRAPRQNCLGDFGNLSKHRREIVTERA